jgi:hypothetical protein
MMRRGKCVLAVHYTLLGLGNTLERQDWESIEEDGIIGKRTNIYIVLLHDYSAIIPRASWHFQGRQKE